MDVAPRAPGRSEFIALNDSPGIGRITHVELLFCRGLEANGDTPGRTDRGSRNWGTSRLYLNCRLVGLEEPECDSLAQRMKRHCFRDLGYS